MVIDIKLRMVFGVVGIVSISNLILIYEAKSWPAVDTITCREIEVLFPLTPAEVASPDGSNEVQFRVENGEVKFGEATGWLTKCIGKCCLTKHSKNFELNTFSDYGLLYVRPVSP